MEVPTLATEDAGGSLQLVETARGGEPAVALLHRVGLSNLLLLKLKEFRQAFMKEEGK